MSVELTVRKYDPSEFINTATGQHKISKGARIFGSQQIAFARKVSRGHQLLLYFFSAYL
jgi:hypothetical protein